MKRINKLAAKILLHPKHEIPIKVIKDVFGEGIVKRAWSTSEIDFEIGIIDCTANQGQELILELVNGNVIAITNSEWMAIINLEKYKG